MSSWRDDHDGSDLTDEDAYDPIDPALLTRHAGAYQGWRSLNCYEAHPGQPCPDGVQPQSKGGPT